MNQTKKYDGSYHNENERALKDACATTLSGKILSTRTSESAISSIVFCTAAVETVRTGLL